MTQQFDSANGGAPKALYYVLFNDGWDRLVGNTCNQMMQAASQVQQEQAVDKYLEYLVHSLESFRRYHADGGIVVRICLVELSREGMDGTRLRAFLESRLPGFVFHIGVLGHRHVSPFLEEARAMPQDCYRSPNRMHEACLFNILRSSTDALIAIVDPDVTFLTEHALDDIWSLLLAQPEKWAADFIETGRKRPWKGGWVEARERMHSVAVFFKVEEMRRNVRMEPFLRPASLDERLVGILDRDAVAYFQRYKMLDTFSLLTELLRTSYQVNRLINLNELVPHFFEGQMLTLVCDRLIHCKYQDPTSRYALEDALKNAQLDREPISQEIQDLLALARGS